MVELKELCEKAHKNAREKGFWEDWDRIQEFRNMAINISPDGKKQTYIDINNAITTRLMLIVSELSEALEALRERDGDNFAEELADVAIRLGDLCGGLDIDLEKEVIRKMERNEDRPYKHGKQF